MKKLLVIDGNSILNRAFYGVRPLTNSAGLHTNALFGMLGILQKQINEVKPDYAAIAFDLPQPTFRHKEYSDYKAGRKKMPEELAVQLPYSKRLSECLGLHVLELAGYEADDILGTVSKMAAGEGVHSYVLTGDRDSLQLIDDVTTVLLATNTDTIPYDRARFVEKYGVQPESFVDVKALMGDSSDNIPGVPGIGEVTALKLIAKFENIDNVYDDLDNAGLGKSAKQKMADGKDLAYLSKMLATIVRNAPVIDNISAIEFGGMKKGEMYALLKELEFTSHIKKFGLSEADLSAADSAASAEQTEPCGESKVSAEGGVSAASENAGEAGSVHKPRWSAPATENIPLTELKKLRGRSFAFAIGEGEAAFCDYERCYKTEFAALSELASALAESGVKLAAFDSKKYLSALMRAGASSDAAVFEDDIILCAYVIDPARNGYDLDEMWEIYGEGSISSLGEGAVGEAAAVLYLRDVLLQKLSDVGMLKLYKDIELPLAAVLADMERTGFKLDTAALTEFLEMLKEMESEQAKRIYMLAGREFNINSPKQLGEVLFEELKLPAGKKTKTGYSTGAEILEKLRPEHEIVGEILEYRAVAKLRSTYAEGLLKAADGEGRVHTVFSQTTAVTGRLSSSEPNLQNIPVRTELGREMRRFFIASNEDSVLIDADYSQIELRLLAHIARDQVMTDAFVSGEDVHAVTASQVFGVPLDKVTPEMRKRAKAVNFGIVYGIGEFSLAQDIGVPRKVAGEYIKNYFAKYTGISDYLSAAVESAKALGYVETIFGRRRYIPELTSSKAMLRAFGERVAMNSPIQGSSADIIKLAMINVSKALKAEGLNARLILQIHDELIVESSKADAPRASEILRREMEKVVSLTVPLTVDLQLGSSWFECK